jgi:lambda family phage portal protein
MGSKLIRIPANEVLHVYKVGQGATRMTANRGTSWLAPVFQHLKLLDEYMRYENAAALVASATLAFITQDKEAPVNVDDVTITPTGKAETAIVRNASLDPGSVQYLNAGEDVKRFESGHPSGNFADFVRAALRGVASGLNINYHILASDLENVNFSAGRLGLQEERDHFKCIQTWFIDVLLEPLFIAWSKTNATQSYTSVRNLDTLDWEWITRGWEYMQPVDEATANVMQLKNGLTSFSNIYQNRGLDYRMEFERLAEEKKFAAELGLQFADILPIAVPGAQEVEPAAEVKQEAKTPGAEDAEPVAEPTQAPSAAAKE